MAEILSSPLVGVVFLLALVAILVAIGVYVIGRIRAEIHESEPKASEWLSNFREMHAQGELEDEEYRTIKAVLSERLQHELNDAEKPR
jgi:uncharacterized membrane protein